jgi:hypothetical protein
MQWVLLQVMVNYRAQIITGVVAVVLVLTTLQIHQVKVVLVAAEMVQKQDKLHKAELREQVAAAVLCAVTMHQQQVTAVRVSLSFVH